MARQDRLCAGDGRFLPSFGLEMHSQPDDQAKIIRLGLNAVRANLGIGDAIPNARNIEREAFVEVNRQGADAMMGGFADLRLVYWPRYCRIHLMREVMFHLKRLPNVSAAMPFSVGSPGSVDQTRHTGRPDRW